MSDFIQKHKSSIEWVSPEMSTLKDLCKIYLIWNPGVHQDSPATLMVKSIVALKGVFEQLSDFDRFTCGHRMVTYAAFDCATARAKDYKEAKECILQITEGLQGYAMAMGERSVYNIYVNIHNVYSSIPYFFNLPTREYYISNEDYEDALEGIIAAKANCLHDAWKLVRTSAAEDPSVEWLVPKIRETLYCSISPDTPQSMLAALFAEIEPHGYEALRVYLITGRDIHPDWLKARDWPNVEWETVSVIVRDACIRNRWDVIYYLYTLERAKIHTGTILQYVARHSLSYLKRLIHNWIPALKQEAYIIEQLYKGAFQNPDEECLFYLDKCGLRLPKSMASMSGQVCLSLCGVQSHCRFLEHMLSTGKAKVHYWHMPDYLSYADKPCLQIVLGQCGSEFVRILKTMPTKLLNILSTFRGTMDAHTYVVEYLVTSLTLDSPNSCIIQCLIEMLRNTFRRIPHIAIGQPVEEGLAEMRFVAQKYNEMKELLVGLTGEVKQRERYALIKPDQSWSDMLPNDPICEDIVKFLISEMAVHPAILKVTLKNCLYSEGLLPYLHSITESTYNPVMADKQWTSVTMKHFNPCFILKSEYLINVGELSNSMLDEYCRHRGVYKGFPLREVIAHGILSRMVQNPAVLSYYCKFIDLPK